MSDFVICINNDSNPASLILGKVYRTLPDAEAKPHNMVRVIDEDKSEPDGYLSPASMFTPIELPAVAERVLMRAGDRARRRFLASERHLVSANSIMLMFCRESRVLCRKVA